MAGWQTDAERAARKYGIDPNLFIAQMGQEAHGDDLVSGAGALGPAQFMPATARSVGLTLGPGGTVHQRGPSYNAAAKLMAGYVKQYGSVRDALVAYNAGPGRVGGALPSETRSYITTILNAAKQAGGNPQLHYASETPGQNPAQTTGPVNALTASPDAGPSTDATALIQLASQQRSPVPSGQLPTPAALPDMYKQLGASSGPGPKRQDIAPLIDAARTPGQAAANVAAQNSPLVADASTPLPRAQTPRAAPDGASRALQWAESKVGFKETGTNSGGLASYLNQRFGMSNQPWCAMFTSAAVTKGGAPSSARTASVQEVRRQAQAGGGGYRKGFINPQQAKAGDLILWGNDHIAMVQRVAKGKVYYVGGNQSNGVTEASTAIGNGDIVRPLYGAR